MRSGWVPNPRNPALRVIDKRNYTFTSNATGFLVAQVRLDVYIDQVQVQVGNFLNNASPPATINSSVVLRIHPGVFRQDLSLLENLPSLGLLSLPPEKFSMPLPGAGSVVEVPWQDKAQFLIVLDLGANTITAAQLGVNLVAYR